MYRQQLITFFFGALLLFILWNFLLILSPFLRPMLWAMVLAFAFYPLHRNVLKACAGRESWGASVTTLLVLVAFVPVLSFVLYHLVREAFHLYQWLAFKIENGAVEDLVTNLQSLPAVRRLFDSKWLQAELVRKNLETWILRSAGGIGNFTVKQVAMFTRNMLASGINFFLTFFLLFFFLRDGERIYRYVYELTPLEEDTKREIYHQLADTLSAALRGQLFTSLAQGAVLGVVFWALNLPLPIFFAVVTFLASLIPVFGAATIWLPFVVYLLFERDYVRAVTLLALGAGVISFIDNLLKPYVIGEKTKLPYFLLFLGILGGIRIYGMIGIFAAPAVLSLCFVLLRIYRKNYFGGTV